MWSAINVIPSWQKETERKERAKIEMYKERERLRKQEELAARRQQEQERQRL